MRHDAPPAGVIATVGSASIDTVALPVIAAVHDPEVARTVYVAAVVCSPKDIGEPLDPATGLPTVEAPLYN